MSQFNKVSKSSTIISLFLKCDLLQLSQFVFMTVMFGAVVCICCGTDLQVSDWPTVQVSELSYRPESLQISYEAEDLLSSATTQYHSISGEMDVSSRCVAVIRFLSRELSLKRCAVTFSHITTISLDSDWNHCVNNHAA